VSGSSRLAQLALAVAFGLSALSCGEFEHTNPLDRQTSVALRIAGPDTVYTYGDTVAFAVISEPVYQPESVTWTRTALAGYSVFALLPLGDGKFLVSPSQTTESGAVTVEAVVDGRRTAHNVYLEHRTVAIRAGVCFTTPPATSTTIESLQYSQPLCMWGEDARGHPTAPQPSVTVSDPAVLAFAGMSSLPEYNGSYSSLVMVKSLREGAATVRFSVAGMTDSVTVKVRQRIARLGIAPSGCAGQSLTLAVGDSMQLSPSNQAWDPGGSPLADTARVRAASQGMVFHDDYNWAGYITVSPTGLVKALMPGFGYVVGSTTSAAEGNLTGYCTFRVY
jgi:hypothetical protein